MLGGELKFLPYASITEGEEGAGILQEERAPQADVAAQEYHLGTLVAGPFQLERELAEYTYFLLDQQGDISSGPRLQKQQQDEYVAGVVRTKSDVHPQILNAYQVIIRKGRGNTYYEQDKLKYPVCVRLAEQMLRTGVVEGDTTYKVNPVRPI